jgi:hypothetical protein
MEAMEELETLLPALEEFASDSGVATTLRAAKDRIQKAEANIPQARLKYAAEPLRAGLDKAASQLDVRSLQLLCPCTHTHTRHHKTELHQDVAS